MSTEDPSQGSGDETGGAPPPRGPPPSEESLRPTSLSRPPPPTPPPSRPSLQGITGVPGADTIRRSSALATRGRGSALGKLRNSLVPQYDVSQTTMDSSNDGGNDTTAGVDADGYIGGSWGDQEKEGDGDEDEGGLTREEDMLHIYGDNHDSMFESNEIGEDQYMENPMLADKDSNYLARERQRQIEGKAKEFARDNNLESAVEGTTMGNPMDIPGERRDTHGERTRHLKKRESKLGSPDVVGAQQVRNIFEDFRKMKFFRLCYTITSWHIYWVIYTFIIIIEPFMISQNPYRYRSMWMGQQTLLIFSSILFAIQYLGSLYLVKKMLQEERNGHVTHWEMWKSSTLSPPFYLEIACFACGWIFIWQFPGIASLRCFRFLRIFWYYDLPEPILGPVKTFFAYFAGLETVELSLKVMEFASRTLESMGQEMFYLSKRTRGGFILVFIMFFSSYILGVVLFISTEYSEDYEGMASVPSEVCYSVPSCMYIMVRLTFFDGDAFNYVYTLVTDHPILFGVVCVYFFLTAIGITNGLIGVFGDIFKEASNETFANNKEFEPILSRLTRIESVLLGVDASNVEQMAEVAELAKEEAAHNGMSMSDFNLKDLGDDFDGMVMRELSPEAVASDNKITHVEDRLDKMEMMLSLILARLPDADGHTVM